MVARRLVFGLITFAVLLTACSGVEDVGDVLDSSGSSTVSSSPTAAPTDEPSPEPTDGAKPAIVVRSPVAGDEIGSPVNVVGTADVFEATVSIRILDANGQEIAAAVTTATCGTGCRGKYSERIFFFTEERQEGTIEVFESSAMDGSPQNVVRIPVVLVPGI